MEKDLKALGTLADQRALNKTTSEKRTNKSNSWQSTR
jgi:hypothetical protein